MSKLVIVESGGKISSIQKALGDQYTIVSCGGHIQDLIPTELAVDIDNDFKPSYSSTNDQKIKISKLKSESKNKSIVYIGTDLDYEGHFIAHSCVTLLNLKNYKRIIFNQISAQALKKAIVNAGDLDYGAINAQISRRIIDRLYGFLVTQDLSKLIRGKFDRKNGTISAGRVQSPCLKLIYEKEKEIESFFEKDNVGFFKVRSILSELNCSLNKLESDPKFVPFEGKLAKISGSKNNKVIEDLLELLSTSKYKIVDITDEIVSRKPNPPYETSSLQRDAIKVMKINGKQVMDIAQKLYQKGHITYIRTDCVTISEEGHELIKQTIENKFGNKYYKRRDKKSSKNAQEAHEAIRPTHPDIIPDITDKQELQLYELIWKRTLASQMADSKHRVMTIQVKISKTKEYYFESTNEELIFDGFLKVTETKSDKKKLMTFEDGTELIMEKITAEMDFNKPPTRYTEPSILGKVKNLGIGRPSTSHVLIPHLLKHGHVTVNNFPGVKLDSIIYTVTKTGKISNKTKQITIGKENKVFFTTEIGKAIIECLLKHFENMIDYKFTASIEEEMTLVSKNKKQWRDVVSKYYEVLKQNRDIVANNLPQPAELKEICNYNDKKIYYSPSGKYGAYVFYIDGKTRVSRKLGNTDISDEKGIIALFENSDQKKELFEYKKKKVYLKKGQHGDFITYEKSKGNYVNRSVKGFDLENIEKLKLILEHPKILGKFRKTEIKLCYGPKGFYLNFNNQNVSTQNISVDLETAIAIISKKIVD